MSVLPVFTPVTGLGWFTPFCNDRLCTTDPPGDGKTLPYTKVGPYCVLLSSIALSLGGLIVGSAASFVIPKAKVKWFHKVRCPSVLNCQYAIPCAVFHLLSPQWRLSPHRRG